MVESQSSVQLPRGVHPSSNKDFDTRKPRQIPEPTMVDEDGFWFSKEHKEYVMS